MPPVMQAKDSFNGKKDFVAWQKIVRLQIFSTTAEKILVGGKIVRTRNGLLLTDFFA